MSKNYQLFLFFISFAFLQVIPFKIIGQEKTGFKKELKVGVYNNPPKIFQKQGKPQGIFIDIIIFISEKEDLEVEYVSGDWSKLKLMLQNGEIDILPDVAYSTERDSLFTLNSLPVLESWLEIFSDERETVKSIVDLNGKRIGVLSGSVQQEYFSKQVSEDFGINFQLIEFDDTRLAVQALQQEKIDFLVGDRFMKFSERFTSNLFPTGIILRPTELYFAFGKNAPPELVALFDNNLSVLKNNVDSAYYQSLDDLLKRYEPGIPPYLKWLIIAILGLLILVSGIAMMFRYGIRKKTKELWLRNKELNKARLKAEENERLKTAFLQNMSHEIRTPMNGIIGFMRLLKSPELDAASRQNYIEIVMESGKRLLNTINNIIEISKISSNEVNVNREHVDIRETMKFHLEFFKPAAAEKNIELQISEQIEAKQALVETDKYMLDGVLTNLLNNAIKFTKSGKVVFGNYIEENELIFYVKDSGSGIAENRLKAIFEPFVQADSNINRPYEGSGLGLSIVQSYLELLGGRIWVESTLEKGSTFYFTIPYRKVKPNFIEAKPTEANNYSGNFEKGAKILVAEDDNISFLLIRKILADFQFEIIRAKNGQESVDLFLKKQEVALILMDIKMPLKNGLEATREIREFNQTIPIVAQTAFTQPEDREIAIKAGCTAFISKPIHHKELVQLVEEYLGVAKV